MWSPEYRAGSDIVLIDDVRVTECPVSYITPQTKELLSQILHARSAFRASGASLYGGNLSEWPAWAVDAMSCIENEHVTVENKMIEAQSRSARRQED